MTCKRLASFRKNCEPSDCSGFSGAARSSSRSGWGRYDTGVRKCPTRPLLDLLGDLRDPLIVDLAAGVLARLALVGRGLDGRFLEGEHVYAPVGVAGAGHLLDPVALAAAQRLHARALRDAAAF